MLLEGTIAKLIVKLDPKLYRNYIWRNNNDKLMLYVRLRKALYEMTAGKVQICMYKYIDKILAELPTEMNGLCEHQLPNICSA